MDDVFFKHVTIGLLKFKFAKSNQNWFHGNDMFKHVVVIIDLKKRLKNDKKYTHSIISFHFLLFSWRIEDLMTIMIDLNFKRFMKWGRSFVLWSDILEFLYKRHTGCNVKLRFFYFSPFLWLLECGMENAATDFVMIYWIHWTKRQVWTHWRRYWYCNDLKKKKIIIVLNWNLKGKVFFVPNMNW